MQRKGARCVPYVYVIEDVYRSAHILIGLMITMVGMMMKSDNPPPTRKGTLYPPICIKVSFLQLNTGT